MANDQGSHHSTQSQQQAETRSNLYSDSIRRLENALRCLDQTVLNSPNLPNRDRLVSIQQAIHHMIHMI